MNYITTSISLSMVQSNDYNLKIQRLTSDEFKLLIDGAYSCVGYQDVADILGIEYNKEPVKARPGDILYVANLQQGNLKYYQVEVNEPRQMNYKLEEEMIEWL